MFINLLLSQKRDGGWNGGGRFVTLNKNIEPSIDTLPYIIIHLFVCQRQFSFFPFRDDDMDTHSCHLGWSGWFLDRISFRHFLSFSFLYFFYYDAKRG